MLWDYLYLIYKTPLTSAFRAILIGSSILGYQVLFIWRFPEKKMVREPHFVVKYSRYLGTAIKLVLLNLYILKQLFASVSVNSGGYLPRWSGLVNIHRYSPPLWWIIVKYHIWQDITRGMVILLAWEWTKHSVFCTIVTHVVTCIYFFVLYIVNIFDIQLDSNFVLFHIPASPSYTYLSWFLYWKIIHWAHGWWVIWALLYCEWMPWSPSTLWILLLVYKDDRNCGVVSRILKNWGCFGPLNIKGPTQILAGSTNINIHVLIWHIYVCEHNIFNFKCVVNYFFDYIFEICLMKSKS